VRSRVASPREAPFFFLRFLTFLYKHSYSFLMGTQLFPSLALTLPLPLLIVLKHGFRLPFCNCVVCEPRRRKRATRLP